MPVQMLVDDSTYKELAIGRRPSLGYDKGVGRHTARNCLEIWGRAEIIKIEHPTRGDDTRAWGPPYAPYIPSSTHSGPGESAYFLSVNRNKKSLGISFSTTSGQEIIHSLVKDCDVLVENFLPNTLAKYNLSYQHLHSINPSLIYASITGYGQTGPYSNRAGYDVMVEAEMGLMHITGSRDGPPVKVGVAVTDLTTGLYASNSILAALVQRGAAALNSGGKESYQGPHLDLSLSDCQVATLSNIASSVLVSGERDSGRWGTSHPSIVPYSSFATQDSAILIGGGNDRLFGILCNKLAISPPTSSPPSACSSSSSPSSDTSPPSSWPTDPRFSTNASRVNNRGALEPLIESYIRQHTTSHWLALFEGSGLPYAAVNDVMDTLNHPHVQARGMVLEVAHPECGDIKMLDHPVKWSTADVGLRTPPPTLGQHTDEVLTGLLGMGKSEVERLRGEGVVA